MQWKRGYQITGDLIIKHKFCTADTGMDIKRGNGRREKNNIIKLDGHMSEPIRVSARALCHVDRPYNNVPSSGNGIDVTVTARYS